MAYCELCGNEVDSIIHVVGEPYARCPSCEREVVTVVATEPRLVGVNQSSSGTNSDGKKEE